MELLHHILVHQQLMLLEVEVEQAQVIQQTQHHLLQLAVQVAAVQADHMSADP
jgi:hypothetical protein